MDISGPTSAIPAPAPDAPSIRRVDDQLWAQLAPLLASDKPRTQRGRPRCDDRLIVDGLLWLAYTGAAWSEVPAEFGSKSTCHKRLQEWVARGVFAHAWALLLAAYDDLAALNWSWQEASRDSNATPAAKKGLWAPRKLADALTAAEQAAADRFLRDARRQIVAAR